MRCGKTFADQFNREGAPGRVGIEETPFVHRDAPYLFAIEANWDDPADTEKNISWARRTFDRLKQFSTGGTYLNFPGYNEEKEELVKGAYGKNYERLRSIKRKYDPDNLFSGNFNIKA